jgi:hypothetical protein|tara:strand:+ start:13944 stop:14363 length:420 start_codon:yes stop_codon:yes gene_type:complete
MEMISNNFDVMNLIGEAVEKERYLALAEENAINNYVALQGQFDDLCDAVESHHTDADVCGQRDADLWKLWLEDGGFYELLLTELWYGVQEDDEEEWALMGIGERSRVMEKEREKAFKKFLTKNNIPYDPDRGEWIGDDV